MLTFFCVLFLFSGWIGFFILPDEKAKLENGEQSSELAFWGLVCGFTIVASIFVALAPEPMKLKYLLWTSWPISLVYISWIIRTIQFMSENYKARQEEKIMLEKEKKKEEEREKEKEKKKQLMCAKMARVRSFKKKKSKKTTKLRNTKKGKSRKKLINMNSLDF